MLLKIDLSWVVPFFDSNFFVAIVTFLSVTSAILIYKNQKKDEKIKAARIIIVEIADAESLLDSIKVSGVINLTNIRQVISTNSWAQCKHLFAKDLDERGLKLIDNFYSQCELVNRELNESYNLPSYWIDKAKIVAERHAVFSENSKNKTEYESKKESLKLFEEDGYFWQPNAPKQQMIERVKLIQYISTTPIAEKLKKIAQL